MATSRIGTRQGQGAVASRVAAQAEALGSRFRGSMSELAAQAGRSARRVKDAAHDLRQSPVLQHAIAARERGNLEAAFWLLNEEFTRRPGDPEVAVHYWDVALSLGRVDIASDAGVLLIELRASERKPELAAQHWIELIKEAPDVLVSPAALATLLPALETRLAGARDGGPDDRLTLGGYLRRAMRHAVDPRNSELHPGVALRLFEQGREINPEAARRAAEAALESPHLHEAKRERLSAWLAGETLEAPKPQPTPQTRALPFSDPIDASLSADEIEAAAARLPATKPRAEAPPPQEPESEPEPQDAAGPRFDTGTLTGFEDDALVLRGAPNGRLAYAAIEAVSVAEILGAEGRPTAFIDLILNWSRRNDEPLEIVRLRVDELDLETLVTRKHALGSDFAALMGDIMERTHAVPLPDPESALGTRITCFESDELYERVGLRIAA